MPQRIVWTEHADAEILRLRAAGATWDAIAHRLRVGRNSVVAHGLMLLRGGGDSRPPSAPPVPAPPAKPAITGRPPLPAGHPIAWSLLTDGTSLAGSPYPYPVFP